MTGEHLAFVKMSGAGNDFVVVDHRAPFVAEADKPELARRLCRRRVGVGADGLILIEPAAGDGVDFRMRYFNADGSEGELCGNGTRCAAAFAREIGAAGDEATIATPAGDIAVAIVGAPADGARRVRMTMPTPGPVRRFELDGLPGGMGEVFAVDVGVPHAVEVVSDLDAVDIDARGPAIRNHPAFPRGANANFIALDEAAGELRLRTWERGVEAETLACGTGATAASAVARRALDWPARTGVRVASGDRLEVDLSTDPPRMEGPAIVVYRGELAL